MYEGKPAGKGQEHDIEALLIRMEEAVSTARSVPFSDNCMVDREEMLLLLSMIREGLPSELKQARWLLQQNKQLIAEARKEAENIMRETESRMARMVDEHEITQQARQQAAEILDNAEQNSRQIRSGAMDYAKNILGTVEEDLTEMLVTLQRNKKTLK
ncbi:MAG: ATP synthase F0 subunit B [Clostridiaceae bacterium]|nr:ATP synthase F0 subunit B [Clostridiaceae bacterium]